MITEIKEINFPSYATLHRATVSLTDMGERTISTELRIDGDITPEYGVWIDGVFHPMELEFRGERFVLPVREPQAAKDDQRTESVSSLTFTSLPILQMQRYFFVQITPEETGVAVADKYVVPLRMNLTSFVGMFNTVLDYYFHGSIVMDLAPGIAAGADPVVIDINYTKIWDVLTKLYETYGVEWYIEHSNGVYTIKVGYEIPAIGDHTFEYGYEGGLIKFERQVQDYDVANILLGRGGEKNLPYRYFKRNEIDEDNPEWAADPDAIPELQNITFDRLRDINFRRYVQGWRTNPRRDASWEPAQPYDAVRGETDWAYRKGHEDEVFNPVEYVKDDASIAKYGERWGARDDDDNVYPTIQGVTVEGLGRVDETVAVSDIITDDMDAHAEVAATESVIGGTKTVTHEFHINTFDSYHDVLRSNEFTVPEGQTGNVLYDWTQAIIKDITTDGRRGGVSSHTDRLTDAERQAIADGLLLTHNIKAVNKTTQAELAPEGLPAGTYYLLITLDASDSLAIKNCSITYGIQSLTLNLSAEDENAWKPTFDIWVKNIWETTQGQGESDEEYAARVWEPILGDRVGNEAKIVFSDGFMSASEDYEFPLAEYPVVDRTKSIGGVPSEWRITLRKSDAEFDATGLFIPNATTGGKPAAGDHFFFTGIDMPHIYVIWAEKRLNGGEENPVINKTADLVKAADVNPTWVISLDKVRVHTLEESDYGTTLSSRLVTGAPVQIGDPRFTGGDILTLRIQSLTFTWEEPSEGAPYMVPDIDVVLSEEVLARTSGYEKMKSDIRTIQSRYVSMSDVDEIVRRVGSPIFLRKTGEHEVSESPTSFASTLNSKNFRQGEVAGRGWGHYLDSEGRAVLELDRLIVRQDMQVNSLVANQIEALGGKQISSAASMKVTQVVESAGAWQCYFDPKQGSVGNLFRVNDIVMGQTFDPQNNEVSFYKALVTAVDDNSITITKTGKLGDGAPEEGDTVVQFGNTTDSSRQYVIVRDVIGGGYEQMLSDLNSINSTGKEYYFAGMDKQAEAEFVSLRDNTGADLYDNTGAPLGYNKFELKHRWFVGDHDGEFAEWYDGELTVKGRIVVRRPGGEYTDLDEYMDTLSYLENALPEDEDNVTTISGGIVLSNIIGVSKSGKLVAGLNASSLGQHQTKGKLMIFAGSSDAEHVSDATFRLYENGDLYASHLFADGGEIGKWKIEADAIRSNLTDHNRIELNPTINGGAIRIFDYDDDLVTQVDGEMVDDISEIIDTTNQISVGRDSNGADILNVTTSDEVDLTYNFTGVGQRIQISLSKAVTRMTFKETRLALTNFVPGTGSLPSNFRCTITMQLYDATSSRVVFTTSKSYTTPPPQNIVFKTGDLEILNLAAGTHVIYVRVIVHLDGPDSGYAGHGLNGNSLGISFDFSRRSMATLGYPLKINRLLGNGFASGITSTDYLMALNVDDSFIFKTEGGDAGLQISASVFRIKIDGAWYIATRDPNTGHLILT